MLQISCCCVNERTKSLRERKVRNIDLSELWAQWEPERPELLITLVPSRPPKSRNKRSG